MPGLDGQDASSCGQVGLAHDIRGGTQVGGNAHPLKDRGGRDERFDVRDTESVCAFFDWGCAGFLQRPSEERHVHTFVCTDFLDVGTDGRVEAGGGEIGLGEVCQAFTIEFILKVL